MWFDSFDTSWIMRLPLAMTLFAMVSEPIAYAQDLPPTLSVNDVRVDESAGVISFTVSLSAVSDQDVNVDFSTADGSAVSPSDYIAASGTLTIPAGSGSATITFGNIGDFGEAGSGEESVASMLLAMNPDFITTNGDNNYPDGEEATWAENVLQYYGGYVDAVDVNANRFFATLGNHDYHVFPSAFLNGLALPEGQGNERYYDFVKGPVHFFAIDSNSEQPDGTSSNSVQAQWLQAKLAESTSVWNIVFMHHAPWSSGANHGSDEEMQWPYDAWGVDAILSGHDHIYERILKDEDGDGEPLVYFVNGVGGKSVREFGSPVSGSEVRYDGDLGAMFIRANNASIDFEFHSVSEGLIDQYTLNKPGKSAASLTVDTAIIDDAEIEDAETFTINLSNPVNATLSDPQGTGTIVDNDGARPVTAFLQDGADGYNGMRDTVIEDEAPVTNYGSATSLTVDGSPHQSVLMYWDLSSIPSQSVVQSVDISVDVSNKSGDRYEIYELKRPWIEGEATWNEFAAGQNWETAGANGAEDRGTTVLGTLDNLSEGSNTIPLDPAGVEKVQSWVNDPQSNHGFIIIDFNDASDGLNFASREDETAANRPKLTVHYMTNPVSIPVGSSDSIRQFQLRQNFPNPFNRKTTITYLMTEPGFVTLKIYDLMGREIQSIVHEFQEAGTHAVNFEATNISSGVYLYTLQIDSDYSNTKKMLFLR